MPTLTATTARAARPALLAAALALAACASHPGHYYQDDGPPDHVPAGLASTPDAVPRSEPLNPHANRPYTALGRTFTPDTGDAPFEQRGLASWYGRQYHGSRTASGEPYDMYAMTAAHPTLPIPSYARVTAVRSGRSVIVRINDRGPFLQDRVIDLSYAAAARLGLVGPGSGEVIVQKIAARDIASGAYGRTPAVASAGMATASAGPAPSSDPGGGAAMPVAMPPTVSAAPLAHLAAPAAAGGAARAAPPEGPWAIQFGAFRVAEHAQAFRDRLDNLLAAPEASDLPPGSRHARIEFDGQLHRVLVGGFRARDAALAAAQPLEHFLARASTLYRP